MQRPIIFGSASQISFSLFVASVCVVECVVLRLFWCAMIRILDSQIWCMSRRQDQRESPILPWNDVRTSNHRAAHVERNPNWTLSATEAASASKLKRTNLSNATGSTVESIRSNIEGTRSALTQFAARNQRIVADPFPTRNACPRVVRRSMNLFSTSHDEPPPPRSATPPCSVSHGVASSRVVFNTTRQEYETKIVPLLSPSSRGFASASACFAVSDSGSVKHWRSTALDVKDFASTSRPRSTSPSNRGAVRDINYPDRGLSPRAAALARRGYPHSNTPMVIAGGRQPMVRPKVVPPQPAWWGC